MRPLLKWPGGKSRLADRILSAFCLPGSGTYFEPFLGGGGVFFYGRAKGLIPKAVLSDVNPRLIGMYTSIRDEPSDVFLELLNMPYMDGWKAAYAPIREAYNNSPPGGPEQAARLLWLNRACYNGLYRENRRGEFNVAPGDYASLKLHEPEEILSASEALSGVDIYCQSFEATLANVRAGDRIFVDPPYVDAHETKKSFTGYSRDGFGEVQQRRLRDVLVDAAIEGASAVLTNHDSKESRDLYRADLGFSFEEMAVRRNISRDIANRTAARELLVRIGPL